MLGQLEHVPSVPGSFWPSYRVQPHRLLFLRQDSTWQEYHIYIILSERRKQDRGLNLTIITCFWIRAELGSCRNSQRAWSKQSSQCEETPFDPALEAAWYR